MQRLRVAPGGSGRQVAEAFVREGAAVMVADLGTSLDGRGSDPGLAQEAAEEICAAGGMCRGMAIDVGDREQARVLVAGPLGATANVFIPQAATRMTHSIPIDQLPEPDRWKCLPWSHIDGR